jgi:hypothetical protein
MKSKYLTGMKQCFIDLGDPQNTNKLYLQRQQADKLIEGMENTHAAVESARLICSDKQWDDFHQAVKYLSGQIAWIFPKSYKASTNNNNKS